MSVKNVHDEMTETELMEEIAAVRLELLQLLDEAETKAAWLQACIARLLGGSA